ncbi:MAG: Uma2 family endonuclease [Lachnospiraceae bacterium]|nr:Uma2 family endonuclease [Lachnospiraceae bacterium]MCM1241120.1 Uma2 family endonuclease [Lachnospiraceae bacterium]MCM1304160.1 Uma2 family endonuclease [Butyrivibrio sp.]MCM1344711.1 Uma2 family endonuclease [Muribaculaceae bacterium]MCM1411960.1 Uma2 family endonuclease [Lachnospiraceae bacterium]
MSLPQENFYTVEDIYALPDGQRAELIDGRMYMMAPPNYMHQKLIMGLSASIHQYIKAHGGNCEVLPAPFAVFLNEDERNYVEPDISVVCDKDKLTDKGCSGAPDWVIEVTSPGTSRMDYGIKLFKYRSAGVREYWVVNPQKKTVMVYDLEKDERSNQYVFDDTIPVCIYDDLFIQLSEMLK